MHVAERHHPTGGWSRRCTRHCPNLAALIEHRSAGIGNIRHVRVRQKLDQELCHASTATVQDANDDLLAYVTALGGADGAVEKAGLKRDRVRCHVDTE